MIDTETKRRSVLGYTLGLALVLPVADGVIASVDKAHVAGLYSGLTYAAAAPNQALTGELHTQPRFAGDKHTQPRYKGVLHTAPRLEGEKP